MELRHLRYFVALAERLNFTAAAEQVHVTQPTLSHQIKQLEIELGQPLFERTERRVSLTAAGELLLPSVLEALKVLDAGTALLKTSPADISGHIRLATSQTFNIAIIPQAIAMYQREHPAVKITVEEFTLEEMTEKLRRHAIDMAVAYRPLDCHDLVFEPLCNEELVLIARPDHPLAQRKKLRMIELHGRDMALLPLRFNTRQQLQEAFSSAGTEPNAVIEAGTIASLLKLVQETGLPTILSRYAVPPDCALAVIPLESPRPVRTTGLLRSKNRAYLPVEAAFTALLRRVTDNYLGH